MRAGLCLTIFGALLSYLLAAGGWIAAAVGYGLLINVQGLPAAAANNTGLTHYPSWAFVVGAPFVMIALGMQIVILATRMQRKACWGLFAFPLAFLLAYLFAAAGAVLYSVSESVHRIVLNGTASTTDVYTLVQFTGTLAAAVFSVCALGCIFAATPHAFDTGGPTRVTATTTSTATTSTEIAQTPELGWTARSENYVDVTKGGEDHEETRC